MAKNPQRRGPIRTLIVMLVITLGLTGFLGAVHVWGEAQLTPKLGLDLEGGTQMTLRPQVREGQDVNTAELDRAVDIIRKRVDGQGVAEAEVGTLGTNVVVTVPGQITQDQQRALEQSSQMRFRPVLGILPTQAGAQQQQEGGPQTLPGGTAPPGPPETLPAAPGTATTGASPAATSAGAPATTSAARAPIPHGLLQGAAVPAADSTPAPAPSTVGGNPFTTAPSAAADQGGLPQWYDGLRQEPTRLAEYALSEAWLTSPELGAQAQSLTCPDTAFDPAQEDLTKPIVICGEPAPEAGGQVLAKYVLGPAVLTGDSLADATSGMGQSQGGPTGQWVVNLKMNGGLPTETYAAVSRAMVPLQQPRNQLAVVLDDQVISAPYFRNEIVNGQAEISGSFTAESSKLLADQLKFGSLPMSFEAQELQSISPTIGGDQLSKGIIAGLIGLALVIMYSLFQYRVLGLVTVASILLVALLTYLTITLFGWSQNLRLTMAGVTGAIVAIGTTADSFIVYFERVRDEIRDGRSLIAAVDTGWARAKRTILVSDGVNFLAAAVLYLLAASNVRGFAFMLMWTTLLDIIVTFLFTHPLLKLLATTKFFGSGHPWSGLSPERLGAKTPLYRGRGRVAVPSAATRSATARTAIARTDTAGAARAPRAMPRAATEGGPA